MSAEKQASAKQTFVFQAMGPGIMRCVSSGTTAPADVNSASAESLYHERSISALFSVKIADVSYMDRLVTFGDCDIYLVSMKQNSDKNTQH